MYTFLLGLAAILIATKLFGELARKFGQSSSIGALFAGAILGDGALALISPRDPTLQMLAQLGLLVLLFQIGLRTDVSALRRARGTVVPSYTGHAEVWFDRGVQRGGPEAATANERAIEDESKFIDFKRSCIWIGKEHVFIDRM